MAIVVDSHKCLNTDSCAQLRSCKVTLGPRPVAGLGPSHEHRRRGDPQLSELRERNYITVTKSRRVPLQPGRRAPKCANRQVVSSVTEPFERFATNRWGPATARASGSSNMYSGDESTLTTAPVEALNSLTELPS